MPENQTSPERDENTASVLEVLERVAAVLNQSAGQVDTARNRSRPYLITFADLQVLFREASHLFDMREVCRIDIPAQMGMEAIENSLTAMKESGESYA